MVWKAFGFCSYFAQRALRLMILISWILYSAVSKHARYFCGTEKRRHYSTETDPASPNISVQKVPGAFVCLQFPDSYHSLTDGDISFEIMKQKLYFIRKDVDIILLCFVSSSLMYVWLEWGLPQSKISP